MKIAVFGGAFDPPHHGHIALVKEIQSQVKPDKFLIIPTGIAPHKPIETDYATRLALCKGAFVNCGDNVEISEAENTGLPNYTVDTLRKLHELYPGASFVLAVGSDAFDGLDTWRDPEQIRELCEVVQVSRDIVQISSSQIRDKFLKRKRYVHSLNVAIKCGELAKHHGLSLAEREKAYIAGLYHDIEKSIEKRFESFPTWLENEYGADPVEKAHPKLWHGIAGAVYVRDELKIHDDDILNAIRFHTIARACMSEVEKIVYVSDKVSPEREAEELVPLRRLAYEDLDAALYSSIMYLREGMTLPACTEAACECYEQILHKRKEAKEEMSPKGGLCPSEGQILTVERNQK
ncbi:MAG: bis(5'-nucleosyl)-tetraphosphatase (symmetrical) YqeK [Oscillospiraceae bacterium]|nr:bis(5'-nucleosyl)-tetraphosphatase (symmetrical) YqeK [Oscillospiraceae bacterium]